MSEQNHQKRPIAVPQSAFAQKHQIAYSLYESSCAVEVFFQTSRAIRTSNQKHLHSLHSSSVSNPLGEQPLWPTNSHLSFCLL